jgi:hypothetical protein
MKKSIVLAMSLVLLVLGFAGCAKKAGVPVAGSAAPEDMLTLLPKDIQGVVIIDAHRGMTTEFVDKAIKESKEYAKYQEVTASVGIDPQKDVYLLAVGVKGGAKAADASPMAVLNLRHDPAKLLAKIKEKAGKIEEETYEGLTIYTIHEPEGKPEGEAPAEAVAEAKEKIEDKAKEKAEGEIEGEVAAKPDKPVSAAFLDASNIVVGPKAEVKAVIDVLKGKAESALKNDGLMAMVKTANKTAIVWCVFSFTPDQVKEMSSSAPMLQGLETLKALTMFFDYKDKGLQIEIKALTSDATKNKEIADFLNGLKAMGSMGAAEKPEVGELLNKIEVSSGPDNVKIYVNLPEALLEKLGQEAKKQVEAKLEGQKPEEKKEEGAEIKK